MTAEQRSLAGKPDDTAIKDILSPYAADRSAVADCVKLAESALESRRAILIYGFDDARRPLEQMIAAFETLAGARVRLGPRCEATLGEMIHPVHRTGRVCAWEISPLV